MTVDDRLTRTPHLSEVKKNLANKFLSKRVLEQFSFSVILPWLLNQLDTKKATGLDRTPCKLLQISTSIVGPSLTYIFKSCRDAAIFPNEWEFSKVTPLFKKGSKRELGNYRPISVLPLISKIIEKIVYRQLYDYLQDNSLLNTYQSSYRSMHSALTALLETTNNWSINIDDGL